MKLGNSAKILVRDCIRHKLRGTLWDLTLVSCVEEVWASVWNRVRVPIKTSVPDIY